MLGVSGFSSVLQAVSPVWNKRMKIRSPERSDVDITHAALDVISLEIARFCGVDDPVHTTFDLDTFACLDPYVCVRLEPFVGARYQHATFQ